MSRLLLTCAVCATLIGCKVVYYDDDSRERTEGDSESTFIILNYRVLWETVDERTLQLLAVNLKAFNRLLQMRLGRPRRAMPQMVMRLYENPDEFEKMVGRDGVVRYGSGAVEPGNRAVHLLLKGDVMDALKRIHTYVYLLSFSSDFPAWVVEGFIEYFGDAELVGGQFVVPFRSGKKLKDFVESATSTRLSDVINAPKGTEFSKAERLWAWALIYWFMRVYPKKGDVLARKKALMRYLLRIMEEGASSVSFEESMGRSTEEIEEAVLRWAEKRSKEDAKVRK